MILKKIFVRRLCKKKKIMQMKTNKKNILHLVREQQRSFYLSPLKFKVF